MSVPATCEVVVDHVPPAPPPPERSVPHTGKPPVTFSTSPGAPIESFARTPDELAYKMSPVA